MAILLIIFGTLAGANLFSFLQGAGNTKPAGMAAAVFSAIFLLLVFATYQSIRSQFRVRVIPYFERPLGQKDTWLSGENYLQHSRMLDEIATRIGVQPLSEFASGDDLIRGESLHWFQPENALRTTERLLQTDISATLPSTVVSDLTRIRDALRLACSQSVKFCFLIREGASTSGLEMERRKGSFF